MSTRDINHEPDQEFDDFLLGQGDLASLLQSLPQPAPSAELDARILRDAEIALASKARATAMTEDSTTVSATSSQKNSSATANNANAINGAALFNASNVANAANDPAPQPGQRPPASFFSRWRYPLGLAATLVLTMSVTLSVWRGQSIQETPSVLIAGEARRVNGPDTPAPAASTAAQPTSSASPAAESAAAPAVVATPAAAPSAMPAPEAVPAAAPASGTKIAAIPQPVAAGLPAPATSAKDAAAKEEAVKGSALLADAKTGAAPPSPAAPVGLAKARDAKRDAATEPARPADELAQQTHKKAKRIVMDNSPVLAEAASQEKAQAPAVGQIQARGQVLASAQENKQMAREDDYANRQASEALAQSRMQQALHNRAQQMQDKSQEQAQNRAQEHAQNRSQELAQNRAHEQALSRAQSQSQDSRAMAARAQARAEADMADSAPAQVAAAPSRAYASPPPPAVAEARAAPEARPAPANVLPGIDTNRVGRAEASTVQITGARHAPAQPAAPKEAPQAWFERIEKLLKDGKRKEALEEWQKFQATHPAFVVPAATLKELEALRGPK